MTPTGWTRQHLADLADESLLALRPWATPDHARFDLPGPAGQSGPVSDGLEAFARSFLAVGFRLSTAESDPHDHAGWYARGLAAGTDPDSPERWPSLVDVPQARVEAAAISIALHETRRWIWDRLPAAVQGRVVDWLAGSIGAWYPESNWQWFHNVTQAFLRSVGGPHDQARTDEFLAYLDGCYLGDGWYSDGRPDGRGGNIDWYAGFVMQLFSVWYCRMSAGEPGIVERQALYAERLQAYVASAAGLFGADGAPLYQGRSLVYRHAVVGALWAGAVFDANPLPPGRLRHTCLGAIKYFVERGAYDKDGLLSLGWLDRFEPMRQPYSGPGGPYWASLGFAGLLLPETHPVWTEPEEVAPIEGVRAIRPTGWLVAGTEADGIVRVINHGVDHSTATPGLESPLYNRFGYSTVTAPVPLTDGSAGQAVDNQVALVDAAGRWSQRPLINLVAINNNRAESRHIARFARTSGGSDAGPELECVSVVRGPIEIRAVRLTGTAHLQPDREAGGLVVSGFGVPREAAEGARGDLVSAVVSFTAGGVIGRSVHELETAFGAEIEVPWCRFDGPEVGRWYVVGSYLGVAAPDWPTVVVSGTGRPSVAWPDGVSDEI
ncbi:DUF2264 domain-containing protein [Kribbella sp. GL6]|uniref:DUF2264 domain-containing protein n=1 Tax=Kribbella sp. GL6 TaxID=3419765 RepID=UPI003CFDB6C1